MTLREKTDFVNKLYNIIDSAEYERYIVWADDGKSFLILSPQEFSENVLQYFFRHKNLSSFIRQLNKYDFHKIKSSAYVIEKYGPQVLEFRNTYFIKNNKAQLYKIKRKNSAIERHAIYGESFPGVENNFVFQNHVLTTIKSLTEKFQALTDNIEEMKSKLSDIVYDVYSKKVSVLIYNEDIKLSMYLYALLKNHNISITILDSNSNLYNIMKESKFNLIVLGIDYKDIAIVMRYFRSFDYATPVIYIGYEADCVDFASMGVNDFIKKPFSHSEFLTVFENYLPKK